MSKGIVYVYDPVAKELVTKDEFARREAARKPPKMTRPAFLPDEPQRGHWVYDREQGKVVTAAEYYGQRPVYGAGHGLQVIPDIQPYKSMHDGSRIGGRRQHREHLREHGLVEFGNEMPTWEKPKLPPAGPDIKEAIEMVRAGHRPPPLERYRED